jgi:IclR family acetate operon transcriptional repressor
MREDPDKVQSVERAITLLETLADAAEMGIKELSVAMGLPKGTVHRLLSTMKDKNVVDQTATGKYRLGFKLYELGSKMVNRLGVRKEAMPHLENLTKISGETANLAIPDHFDVIYVERIASLAPLRLGVDLGCRFPAYALGLGKAIMANLAPAELDEYLSDPEFQASIKPFTDNTITNIVELRHHLEAVRKQGYAVDNEEYLRGIRCIAAPIFNYSGKVIAAIGISGATATMTSAKIQEMIPYVKEAGRNVSRNLGYSHSTM